MSDRKNKKLKNKAAKNSFALAVLDVFNQNPYKSYNFRQLSRLLGISDNVSKQLVKEILNNLAYSREILEQNRGRYRLNPENIKTYGANIISGTVDMKQTGKAYIMSGDLSEDIYIAANNTHHALHGDKVKVRLFPARKGRKTEGEIIEITERGKKQFVGIVEISKNYAFLIPDDVNVPVDIFIPLSNLHGARNGNKAVAVITDWPEHSKNPFGEITEVLGKPGEHEVEMKSILADFDFPLRFPDQCGKRSTEDSYFDFTAGNSRKEGFQKYIYDHYRSAGCERL